MINVTQPHLPDIKKYQKYLKSIYKSKLLTNNGPLERELTSRLSEYLGVKNILLVANGTIALSVAYKLLGITKSVITTPFSFVATTSSMVWDNITPVFSDINSKTFNLEVSYLDSVISSEIEAIVPVHVYGNACDIDSIQKFAVKNRINVIYDASHAFDVKYKSESILNFGDISTLSFHATKLFHTVEGGALIIKDDELYNKAKQIINFGYSESGGIENIGVNAKLSEFHAAMGLANLDDIDEIFKAREHIVNEYICLLDGVLEYQEYNKDCTRNFSYFPVLFDNEKTLEKCVQRLNSKGIFPRRYFTPSLNKLTYIKNAPEMMNSENIASRILCLPLYEALEDKDVKFIVDLIKEAI